MPVFKYVGKHKDAITGQVSSSAVITEWVDASVFDEDGRGVCLVDRKKCEVYVCLLAVDIEDKKNWDGNRFSLDAGFLDITVTSDSVTEAYDALSKGLFDRFQTQRQTGQAHFPLTLTYQSSMSSLQREVSQIDLSPMGVSLASEVQVDSDDTKIEYLTVTVTESQGGPENWTEYIP